MLTPNGFAPDQKAGAPPPDDVLTYYHFQITQKRTRSGGVVNWATSRAANVWANFGKAAEGGWQVRTPL